MCESNYYYYFHRVSRWIIYDMKISSMKKSSMNKCLNESPNRVVLIMPHTVVLQHIYHCCCLHVLQLHVAQVHKNHVNGE